MPPRRRRRSLALLVALVGLVVGVGLWIAASARHDSAVESLARAPIGCDTTLDFERAGEYLVFVETRGTLPEVAGDCGRSGAFDLDGSAPSVDVRIVDADGDELTVLTRRDRERYDRAGSTGSSLVSVTISEPGDHVLRATSGSEASFGVAIGTDPEVGVTGLRVTGLVVALLAVAVAVIIAASGRRGDRRVGPPSAAPAMPATTTYPVSGPPTMHPPSGPPAARPPWLAPPPPAPPGPSAPQGGSVWAPIEPDGDERPAGQ